MTIDQLGHRGDGVSRIGAGAVFIPGTLAGETVRASISGDRGKLIDVVTPSADRIDPFCRYFGRCGGCALQHLADAAYADWKRGIVVAALAHRGLEAPIEPLADAHGAGRRRATLHACRSGKTWTVGFAEARSHRIFDLTECPILVPELAHASKIVRDLALIVPTVATFDAQLTATDGGLDVHLVGVPPIDLEVRTALATIADRLDLSRVAIDGETILERRMPRIVMGGAAVAPPPGSFLQATAAGEQALSQLVREHLRDAHRIADLFCGIGPFALRLAANANVYAADSAAASVAALSRAARAAPNLRPIEAETRDLQTRPLFGAELERFDGIVFDPPRAGAEPQVRQLASSRIPLVVSVSCDAATFARDAAILVAGGFILEKVYPIDQFKWSPHIEIVGLFRREL